MKHILVKNDLFRLSRNKQVFEIEFVRPPNRVLVDSLVQTRLLENENVTLSEDYRTLQFKAFSASAFLDWELEERSIGSSLQMLSSLTTQLSYLIDHGHTFIGYNTKNIIVINGSVFVFLDSELLTEIVCGVGGVGGRDVGVGVRYPFSVHDFYFSPELLKITEIPSVVSYKTAYFSLGFLLLEWISSKGKEGKDLYKEYLRADDPCSFIKERLASSIPKSKLYWLLERSLVEDPLERSLLFL